MVSLSIDSPRHGRRSGGGGSLRTRLLVVAVIFGLGAGAGFWAGRYSAREGVLGVGRVASATAGADGSNQGDAAQQATAGAVAPAPNGAAAAPAAATPGTPAGQAAAAQGAGAVPGATVAAPSQAAPAAPAPAATGIRRAVATVSGALEDGISKALAPEDRVYAEQLTQVVNRLLVWNLNVARDGRRGDRIEVVWEPAPPVAGVLGVTTSKEPVVHAVRYASQKLGKEVAAYRFQPPGSAWARYYQPDGTELEERLVDSPIADYEQVTSLLRDGRKHKGVDFKTPTGTPVVAPFDGRIIKRNWNFAFNGNCLEIVDSASGRHAIFLHLDVLPKDVGVGRVVKKGERIASSGNSGRSYAPHLHYQLEDAGGRVLDPFAVHATKRLSLTPEHKALFEVARAKLDAPSAATAAVPAQPVSAPVVPAAAVVR